MNISSANTVSSESTGPRMASLDRSPFDPLVVLSGLC